MENMICISTTDFTEYIMDYIFSQEFQDMFNSTSFSQLDDKESFQCLQAMRHGLNWATLLMNTNRIPKFVIKGDINEQILESNI